MADLTITASAVKKSTDGQINTGFAGETIAAGETVYFDSSLNQYLKADGNVSGKMPVVGIAWNSASLEQPITVIFVDPELTIGTHGIAIGTPLFQSATPGKLCPLADLTTGNQATALMVVKTTTTVAFGIITGGTVP